MSITQATTSHTRVHGGNPWTLMRANGRTRDAWIDFSVDVNPRGAPDVVRDIIHTCCDDVSVYPDPEATSFRTAIAQAHDIPVETVLPGNGAADLINVVAQQRSVQHALVLAPTFTEYAWAAARAGAEVSYLTATVADGFHYAWSADVWRERLRGMDIVFLCNPNNPTGGVVSRDDVLQLVGYCHDAGALLVVDEAYMDFMTPSDETSVLSHAAWLPNLIVIRSLTKSFAIPGLRLGYAVAHPAIIEHLRAMQSAWPLNIFAMAVGEQLMHEQDYMEQSRRRMQTMRDIFFHDIASIPYLQPYPSVANFLLCRITSLSWAAARLYEYLATRGVIIRCCDDFVGLEPGRFIRLAVKEQPAHDRLLHVLRELSDAC
jgi:threonine-phosphate decarboxylase